MKTVAVCANPFLPETAPWLYHQIRGLSRFRPVVLTQETLNAAQFPVPVLYSAEALSSPMKWLNRLARGVLREFPLYAGIMGREGADLIHAHFGHHACRCLRARRASGLPMITSFYGADATQFARLPRWQKRYRRLFREGELFLAEGSAMAAQLERIGCPVEKLRIHHLGVAVNEIPFLEREPTDRVRVLICASFREKKGIPLGLRALGRALAGLDLDCRVTLIGDGPDRDLVMAAVADAGLEGRVDWRGMLSYSQVLAEMAQCQLLLQPSITASDGDSEGGAPVILLDAQAAGLPVVATSHADIPEYVLDGESGLLTAERDEEALAESLRSLLTEQDRWGEMGRRGRRHVTEHYDAARQCRSLEEIYDEIS
jgi:colanic acid/amylovoran biosynthesis glycosyltransferase